MTKTSLRQSSIVGGEGLELLIEDYAGPTWPSVSFEVCRVEVERDICVLSTNSYARVSGNFSVTIDITQEWAVGIYRIENIRLVQQSNPIGPPISQIYLSEGQSIFFEVRDVTAPAASEDEIRSKFKSLSARRVDRIRTPIVIDDLVGGNDDYFTAAVLVSGLLIHNPQHCEGYSLIPFGNGLGLETFMNAANEYVSTFGAKFETNPEMVREIGNANPLLAIFFHRVFGATEDRVKAEILERAREITSAIAFDRGHVPRPFAIITSKVGVSNLGFFYDPFHGNMLAPFSSSEIGEVVERLTTKMARSPFAKLLIELVNQANAERDAGFKYFRLWAIVELLAKRAVNDSTLNIHRPDGSIILRTNGKPYITQNALACVYKYLFDSGAMTTRGTHQTIQGQCSLLIEGSEPAAFGPDDRSVSLWNFLGAVYAVRNAIAHEGRFVPDRTRELDHPIGLASNLIEYPIPHFLLHEFKQRVDIAVKRELNQL